jgi:D-threonine aldolase
MKTPHAWYEISHVSSVDTPALVVYPERIQENIRLLKGMVSGPEWLRPHVKTHKMAEVVRLMQDEGIHKFKCATIAEAEMLALTDARDVLLAYQPVGPKAERLLKLVQTYPATRFSCLVDNPEAARFLAQTFTQAGQWIQVFLDLNVGMNRTGITPGKAALELFLACKQMTGIVPVGLHAYDGHLRDTDIEVRRAKSDEAFRSVTELAGELTSRGEKAPVLVAGGSPTFPVHAQRAGVECSPGTFIFWDWGYQTLCPEQKFRFAALVLTRIVSQIDAHTFCLDLGHKAVAAENPLPRVHFLNAPDLVPVSQSEEHLVVRVEGPNRYRIGDVFYGVPVHICPTCALYEQAYAVVNNAVTDTWKVVSRNRYIHV